MRRASLLIAPLVFAAALAAQPRLTFDYPAIAKRLAGGTSRRVPLSVGG